MQTPRYPEKSPDPDCRCIHRSMALGLLAALCSVIAASPAHTSPFHHTLDHLTSAQVQIWRATVALDVQSWKRGLRVAGTERGTGLVVGVDRRRGTAWIATASHAVVCAEGCSVRVVVPGADPAAASELGESEARILWRHRSSDLALLEVAIPPGVDLTAVPLGQRRPGSGGPGDRVVAMGFPDLSLWQGEADSVDGEMERAATLLKVYSSGRLEARRQSFRSSVRAYGTKGSSGTLDTGVSWIHTASILPGSSGGPLVAGDGAILGLNIGSLTTEKGGCVRSRSQPVATEPEPCLHLAVDLEPLWREVTERTSP